MLDLADCSVGEISSWYRFLPMRLPTLTIVLSLVKDTLVSTKRTESPVSVTAAIERRLVPSQGTYNTFSMVALRFFPPTSTVNMMSPIPRTCRLAESIPFTFHLLNETSVRVLNMSRWSVMCCVAPESAIQSSDFLEMKRADNKRAYSSCTSLYSSSSFWSSSWMSMTAAAGS